MESIFGGKERKRVRKERMDHRKALVVSGLRQTLDCSAGREGDGNIEEL